MHRGYRVVACIPAGRKRVLELNLAHLRAQQGFLDGVMLWTNTDIHHDLEFIEAQRDGFVCPVPLDEREPAFKPKQLNTGRFYRYTVDPTTIYIRLDDDVVWQHPDALRNLVNFRIDHPEYFVVFANIWNNAVISAIQQERGMIGGEFGKIQRYCMDNIAWRYPEFGVHVHRLLLDRIAAGTTEELFFPSVVAEHHDAGLHTGLPLRFSVSCFAWFGSDFAKFDGELGFEEEEAWITRRHPLEADVRNAICGDALVSHYSFFTQRPLLDTTDVLDRYRVLAEDRLHDAYYDLLAVSEGWEPFEVEPWWV